jgi:hypothetical protein
MVDSKKMVNGSFHDLLGTIEILFNARTYTCGFASFVDTPYATRGTEVPESSCSIS